MQHILDEDSPTRRYTQFTRPHFPFPHFFRGVGGNMIRSVELEFQRTTVITVYLRPGETMCRPGMFSTLSLLGDPAGSSASYWHLTFSDFLVKNIMVVWIRNVLHRLRWCYHGIWWDLEEVCHWGWPLRVWSFIPHPICSHPTPSAWHTTSSTLMGLPSRVAVSLK